MTIQPTENKFDLFELINKKWEFVETQKGQRKRLANTARKKYKSGTWKLRKV